jgi:hypothetical protein
MFRFLLIFRFVMIFGFCPRDINLVGTGTMRKRLIAKISNPLKGIKNLWNPKKLLNTYLIRTEYIDNLNLYHKRTLVRLFQLLKFISLGEHYRDMKNNHEFEYRTWHHWHTMHIEDEKTTN